MALAPMENHWWQVALYLTSRGLTTSPIPCGTLTFDVTFDFIDHALLIETSSGARERIALRPMSVAAFYSEFMTGLHRLGIDVRVWTMPNEIVTPLPFRKIMTTRHMMQPMRNDSAHLAASPPRAQRLPLAIRRQSEPGPFLLGQLRPRGHALFRPACAAASGRGAQYGKLGDARSLFARSEQLRLLARKRRLWSCNFLLLRLSRTAELQRGAAAYGSVPTSSSKSSCCLTTPSGRRPMPTGR